MVFDSAKENILNVIYNNIRKQIKIHYFVPLVLKKTVQFLENNGRRNRNS